MFTFDPAKLQTTKKIGDGRSGAVFPYQKEETDLRWVVKQMLANNSQELKLQIQGIVQGSNHEHPNILPIRGYYTEDQGSGSWVTYIKMPRMIGNLKDLKETNSKKKNSVSKEQAIKYFYDLANALDYLEKKRIPHQNLKPSNILFDQEGKIYLSDIGITKVTLNGDQKSRSATDLGEIEFYTAPEIVSADKPLKKNDLFKASVWSLGVIIADICLQKPKPISSSLNIDSKAKVIKEIIGDLKKNYGQTLPDLVSACLNPIPTQRNSFRDICKALAQKYPNIVEREKSPAGEVKQSANAFGIINTGAFLFKKAEDILGTNSKKGIIEKFEEKKEVKFAKVAGSFLAQKAGGLFGTTKKKDENDKVEEKKDEQTPKSVSPEKKEAKENETKWFQDFQVEINDIVLIKTIDPSKVTDQKVEEVFKDILTEIKSVASKNLMISFRGCPKITDKSLNYATNSVGQEISDLKSIKLEFESCYQITDQGIKEAATNILSNLKSLETLEINFGGCTEVTDQGLIQLGTSISQSSKTLKNLNVDFRGCKKITDDGLNRLVSQIGQHENNLMSLSLDFLGCYQITDESVSKIIKNLNQQSKSLEQLNLEFGRCHQISEKGLNQLCYQIYENIKGLKRLDLSFYGCESITDEAKETIRQTLNYIPNLIL